MLKLRNSLGFTIKNNRVGNLVGSKMNNSLLKRSNYRYMSSHFNRMPENKGLYSSALEKDNCGVGMIAQLKRKPSREIVVQANEMLVRMAHRGGCGCEPNSGDGAGMLVGIPHHFFEKTLLEEANIKLPRLGCYGVGNVFFGKDPEAIIKSKEIFNSVSKRFGIDVITWRRVPTDSSDLGETSLASEPHIEQVFVHAPEGISNDDFERELLRLRRVVTSEIEEKIKDFYVCSISSRTITYKGQLTPEQLYHYYLDLQNPEFQSYLALVHSRFSTNTFPSWDRAQPNRIMCHNGEINTLRGNKNWMFSRGANLSSEYFGDKTKDLLPACSDNMSDSGNFDSVLEIITKAGRTALPEAMMMMIPEAWQNNPKMCPDRKAMYNYYSCLMEPWDGPAMMAFTDGKCIGATLDRNGLRPSRYYVTHDDHVILSSEIGVLPELTEDKVKLKCRLEPGKMFLVDFEKGKIVSDAEVKHEVAKGRPFGKWVDEHLVTLGDLVEHQKQLQAAEDSRPRHGIDRAELQARERERERLHNTNRRLNMFGYTTETMDMLLYPMGITGKEALGSMGNDAPLAVLSQQPKLPFEYFKQLFAQVTNPPIDPIREDLVMTLMCPVGPEGNVLQPVGEHARRLVIPHPVLTNEELQALKSSEYKGWKAKTLDATFPINSGPDGLVQALDRLCEEATRAISDKSYPIIILSDTLAGPARLPVPSLLACGAVHQHLIRTQQRSRAALFLHCGDAREVHDFCTLIGFGADGVCPYVAYEALQKMNADGLITARNGGKEIEDEDLFSTYRNAAGKGILKVMSKMGISTLQSYKGAQVFEAVGLSDDIIELCFAGTTSRIKGTDFNSLYTDITRFHEVAYPPHSTQIPLVRNPGNYHYRDDGEEHFNSPRSMIALQTATKSNSRELFKEYSRISDAQCRKVTIRGLLEFNTSPAQRIPLSEVEPVENIVKRFNTGAMSLGSISREAHETLAVAMNTIGGRSNTGEGGEDIERFTDNRRSAIKQVASGRFGVTSNYLANADQIQIKMAQGAKPGEGGELPGHKVSPYIGSMRHTTPGVGLISPPPHHDIYSIEDLAQLIHDLKNSNPVGEISVKLVSEVGVGVVAAGVAKAKSDHITISGHDGGTGAAAWTGVKNAGLPWELGLAETQQTLVLNNLRSRVRLQTDGQLKTARDVVVAALLGAEEFGFATAPLITLGCIMMRKCHLNTCPVGIATQDEELRKKFAGKPEYVMNFFWLMAEEIREYMAEMGFRTMDEMIGRADMLRVDESALHYKSSGLDLSPLLVNASSLNDEAGVRHLMNQDHGLDRALDNELIESAKAALERQEKVQLDYPVSNLNRSVGTMLSYEISKRYGAEGLPEETIHIKLKGHGGQSLGFALAKGVFIQLEGDSNDYIGKGLSGGKISVYPSSELDLNTFNAADNVIVGNAALYGATSGSAFFSGKAGERFAVRNSGALAVVEGVGDHGCEYMTGGHVVVLGDTGRNFGAGMSGGIAYVYDPLDQFHERCNMGMVGLERIADEEENDQVRRYIETHVKHTNSSRAKSILEDWESNVKKIVKVYPHDYKRVIESQKNKQLEQCA